jgi:hypothetical protein
MVITPFSFHLQIFFISFSAFGLLAIWALPQTIAFRHVCIGLGFIASLFYLKPRLNLLKSINAWPLWILLSLFVWLFMHWWLFSIQPTLQLGELRSTWALSLTVLPLGLALGLYFSSFGNQATLELNKASGRMSLLLFIGLCATPLIFMSGYLEQSFEAKQWLSVHAKPWYDFPYLQNPLFVVATALLLPMCCMCLRYVIKSQANWWWGILAITAISLCVSSNYLSNTKNGMTHSGWLDLVLGIGIPGVLLILIPLGAAWYRSLKMNTLWGSYVSWAIPAFTLTWLITEVIGAKHFIELMIFITAFFIGITLPDKESGYQKSNPLEQHTN